MRHKRRVVDTEDDQREPEGRGDGAVRLAKVALHVRYVPDVPRRSTLSRGGFAPQRIRSLGTLSSQRLGHSCRMEETFSTSPPIALAVYGSVERLPSSAPPTLDDRCKEEKQGKEVDAAEEEEEARAEEARVEEARAEEEEEEEEEEARAEETAKEEEEAETEEAAEAEEAEAEGV